MTPLLTLVIEMAVVTWLSLLIAALVRSRGWTLAGTMVAFGNRDKLPEETSFSGRVDRTARNTLENFALFAAIALTVHAAGADGPKALTGAQIFFWSRIAYIPVYYAGIVFLRTAIWIVSVVGLATMIWAAF
jgi:uncharacterized MAPEG superfamily protein